MPSLCPLQSNLYVATQCLVTKQICPITQDPNSLAWHKTSFIIWPHITLTIPPPPSSPTPPHMSYSPPTLSPYPFLIILPDGPLPPPTAFILARAKFNCLVSSEVSPDLPCVVCLLLCASLYLVSTPLEQLLLCITTICLCIYPTERIINYLK